MATDVNNFYFEDFTGDYYLSRDGEGVSKLEVVEEATAVFPEYRQNKGICRQIAFTNQDGKNVTLANLGKGDIAVTRNGVYEPIYSITKEGDYYNVCTGTEEYVLGRQVYQFSYGFEKAVTDFGDYQELYWDTNGTGAAQRFGGVTARVHMDKDLLAATDGGVWCYVGKYGESGQERCTISKLEDGYQFAATNLGAYEGLTFDVEFSPGTFVVPGPEKSYAMVLMTAIILALCGALLVAPILRFLATRGKRKYYKRLFVKPEYTAPEEGGVVEMAENYMGEKKDAKVGMLLDLVVRKKIEFLKGESRVLKRPEWKIRVVDLTEVTAEEQIILEILNGGKSIEAGKVIEVKRRVADEMMVALKRRFEEGVKSKLEKLGWREKKGSKYVIMEIVVTVFVVMAGIATVAGMEGLMEQAVMDRQELVGEEVCRVVVRVAMIATVGIWILLGIETGKYEKRTEKGLLMSRYMDGMKLYIGMAEVERLKLLQSVEGADTSPEGVVRLYEKLLPYAAVLGLEKSWMGELAKYYEMREVEAPGWYAQGITPMDMVVASRLMSDYARTATTPASSSVDGGGSSSSSFSGGGGGGFSGGGGGGGGFSGR